MIIYAISKRLQNEYKNKKIHAKQKDTRTKYRSQEPSHLVHLPLYKRCLSFSRSKIAYICLGTLYISDEEF